MNNDDRKRFVSNAYIIVGLIAVILIILVFYPKNESWQTWEAIGLNLATELLGVVIVFYLFTRVLLGKEWSLADKVDELLQTWQSMQKPPTADQFFIAPPTLTSYIQQARRIDLCGVVLSSTLKANSTHILNGLRDGKQFRILLADEEGVKGAALRSRYGGTKDYTAVHRITLSDLSAIMREAKAAGFTGTLDVKLLTHVPTMAIKAFDTNTAQSIIFVEVYPYKVDDVLHFKITEADGEWSVYFRDLFEELWRSGNLWQPVEPMEE